MDNFENAGGVREFFKQVISLKGAIEALSQDLTDLLCCPDWPKQYMVKCWTEIQELSQCLLESQDDARVRLKRAFKILYWIDRFEAGIRPFDAMLEDTGKLHRNVDNLIRSLIPEYVANGMGKLTEIFSMLQDIKQANNELASFWNEVAHKHYLIAASKAYAASVEAKEAWKPFKKLEDGPMLVVFQYLLEGNTTALSKAMDAIQAMDCGAEFHGMITTYLRNLEEFEDRENLCVVDLVNCGLFDAVDLFPSRTYTYNVAKDNAKLYRDDEEFREDYGCLMKVLDIVLRQHMEDLYNQRQEAAIIEQCSLSHPNETEDSPSRSPEALATPDIPDISALEGPSLKKFPSVDATREAAQEEAARLESNPSLQKCASNDSTESVQYMGTNLPAFP